MVAFLGRLGSSHEPPPPTDEPDAILVGRALQGTEAFASLYVRYVEEIGRFCYLRLHDVGMLGGTPDEVPEAYRNASPISHVDEESAPFLVIHGAKDFDVPVEHSRRLVEALCEAGVEVVYDELPNADHMIPAWWLMTGPWVLTFLGLHRHPER
jgi:acetyl esterase/lipase